MMNKTLGAIPPVGCFSFRIHHSAFIIDFQAVLFIHDSSFIIPHS
jgi:hypothetical protein